MFGDFSKDLTADYDYIDRIAKKVTTIVSIEERLADARQILEMSERLQGEHRAYAAMVNDMISRLDARDEWHKRALRPAFDDARMLFQPSMDDEPDDIQDSDTQTDVDNDGQEHLNTGIPTPAPQADRVDRETA